MKNKYTAAIVIVLSCILMACQKNGDTPTPALNGNTTLKLWAGADTTVLLSSLGLTGNAFTVSNDHTDIARITTDNEHLIIHSYKPGKLTVTLTNEQSKQFKVNVQPIDMQNDNPGNWRSVSGEGMKSYVIVKTANQRLTDSLYNALRTKLDDNGNNGIFRYEFSADHFLFTTAKTPRITNDGTWTYDKLYLTLNYADVKEVYQIIPVRSINFMILKRDLTSELQQLFPDAGVTEVTTHQYFGYSRFL